MAKEVHLFTPGPTPVPPEVQSEISKPMIYHRSDEFREILRSTRNNLHLISQTDGESVVLTASGTAAMEATMLSLFSPSDHVIIVDGGKFGQRWVQLAHQHRLSFTVVQKSWGKAVSAEDILPHVFSHTRAVLMQACETSTGVYNPVEKIGEALSIHPEVLFVVDAISAFGMYPLSMRTHRIDVMLAASQKALMCPPGLSVVIFSQRATEQLRSTQSMYFSLATELNSQKKNQTVFTPAISLVRGLEKATTMIIEEGIAQVFERHKDMQRLTRGFFTALGFHCFVDEEDAAIGLTVVRTVPGINVESWLKTLRSDYGIWFASGQSELKGAVFRVAHMGYCDRKKLTSALKTTAQSLQKLLPIDKALDFLNQI